MLRRCLLVPVPLAALLLVGCGGGPGKPRSGTVPSTATSAVPALGRAPARAGERVFVGESSPASYGPFELDGTYVVRFEQTAPEDPRMDFSDQTPFTAALERRAGDPRGAVKLFGAARRSGRRTLTIHGRYVLDVSFGDFPFAVRFAPRR
ncbi:MAG: hypothetical protein QOJ63_704 [Solirubrobacteraceae bacterium]|jgi:hypothetical protein|nr:hypothetical protein [Solirubrobacteraceae bacterium]